MTFYNGQFQAITIPAGTVLGGTSGIQVVTDQAAKVPAGNPPNYGQVSVPVHATRPGVSGNIAAYDINHPCCATSVLATNIAAFTGGQDEREFHTVALQDIARAVTPLTTAVAHSQQGGFYGQLTPAERILPPPCRPTVASDHQIGQEATEVTITVSQTCRAVAYNSQDVTEHATALLSTKTRQHLGTGYSVFGSAHVWVTQAAIVHRSTVLLSYSASGTWVYGLSRQAQEHIIQLLAGKTTQAAVEILAALPGVEQASIRLTGFGDASRLPNKQPHEQGTPPEEQEAIRYYPLEGLFPPGHVCALNLALGTILHLSQDEQGGHPLVLAEQQVTEREGDLLLPLLDNYPHFTPYEVLHASFSHGYDHLSDKRVSQARARLETLREERLWDAEMRPIRNVMARLRLKMREVGLDSINVHETGYLLVKNPKRHTS